MDKETLKLAVRRPGGEVSVGSNPGCHSEQFAKSKSKKHKGAQSIDTDGAAFGTTPWVRHGAADKRSW